MLSVVDDGGKRRIGDARQVADEEGTEKKPGWKREKTNAGAEEAKAREERGNEAERAVFSRVVPRGAVSRRCCSANRGPRARFCAAAIRCGLLS